MFPTNCSIILYENTTSSSFGVVKQMSSLVGSYKAQVQVARDRELKDMGINKKDSSTYYKAYILDHPSIDERKLSEVCYNGQIFKITSTSRYVDNYIKIYFTFK